MEATRGNPLSRYLASRSKAHGQQINLRLVMFLLSQVATERLYFMSARILPQQTPQQTRFYSLRPTQKRDASGCFEMLIFATLSVTRCHATPPLQVRRTHAALLELFAEASSIRRAGPQLLHCFTQRTHKAAQLLHCLLCRRLLRVSFLSFL